MEADWFPLQMDGSQLAGALCSARAANVRFIIHSITGLLFFLKEDCTLHDQLTK